MEICGESFEQEHSIELTSEAIRCEFELQCRETTKNPIGTRLSHHNMKITPNCVDYLEKLYPSVRRKRGQQPNDDMLQVDVNMMIWGLSMSATTKAAVHLGQYYQKKHLRTTKNTDFEKINICI